MLEIITSIVGYLAAFFLAVSLLINQTLKFRWISAMGSLCFIIYGIMLHAFPIILTNSILVSINGYKLIKLYQIKEVFEFIDIKKDDEMVKRFLKFYQNDINKYFPDFTFNNDEGKICFFVLRDLNIANIFIGKKTDHKSISVEINYTIQKYRDYKVGKFIFDKNRSFLLSKGISKIIYNDVHSSQHKKFLKKIGFTKLTNSNGLIKEL